MGEYIEPFDFKTVLLDYFLGGPQLFAFAFTLLVIFACANFGMSNRIFMTILAISSLLFSYYLGSAIYVLVLFLIGYISFKAITAWVT